MIFCRSPSQVWRADWQWKPQRRAADAGREIRGEYFRRRRVAGDHGNRFQTNFDKNQKLILLCKNHVFQGFLASHAVARRIDHDTHNDSAPPSAASRAH